MKRVIITLIVLVIVGGAAFVVLLWPEQVSQDALKQDFSAHQRSYEDVAAYMSKKHIKAEITDIPISGTTVDGITYEDSDAYTAFMDGWMNLMCEDHKAIRSDGTTVTFVYKSTGGLLTRRHGEVVYHDPHAVDGVEYFRLSNDWTLHIYK